MYDVFYKLTADPFRLSPDHRFSFAHRSYANAKAYLEYALYRGEGFITITGGTGTGKTTLIAEILSTTDKTRIRIATLNSTQLEGRDLLHMVVASFGLRPPDDSKAGLLLELEQFLAQQSRIGQRCVLIVDEAQGLSTGALEELRLLANLQLNDRLLLQVFLVGQEQLLEVVRAPAMEQLSQRIIAAAHLEPLNLQDTVNYVEHRLSRVGWEGDPKISEDVLRLVYRYSGGVPRRINLICSRLFLHGAMEGKHELTGNDAQSVIEDLQREGLLANAVPESSASDGGSEEAPGSLSLPRRPRAAAVTKSTEQGGTAKPGTASATTGRAAAASPEKPAAKQPPYEPARLFEPAADTSARHGRQPELSVAGSTSRERSEAPPSGPRSGRKKRVLRNSWTKLAMVVALVGLIIVVTNQVFEAQHEDITSAVIKWVDNRAPEPLPQPSVGLPETDQPGTPEVTITDSPQVDQPKLTDLSDASPEPEEVVAATQGDETATAGETMSSPAAAVSAATVAETDADRELTKQGEIIRAAQEADVATAAEPLNETPPRAAAGVVVMSPAVDRLALAPSTETVPPSQTEPATSAPVPPVSSQAETVVGNSDATPQSVLQAEQARLTREAEQRFTRRVTGLEVESERDGQVASPVSPRPVSAVESATPPAMVKRPAPTAANKPVVPSVPKTTADEAKPTQPTTALSAVKPAQSGTIPAAAPKPAATRVAPAPVVVAQAKPTLPETPTLRPDQMRTLLLDGGWNSRGKPASLLPSDVTLCRSAGDNIDCWSVPRNINTKYGEALYKVEATLRDFYWGGKFRVSYRTLVKLVDGTDENAVQAASGSDSWQVSEHTMDCQLLRQNEVACRDEQGVTRTYSR